ncbi:hypothetical protein NM688_g1110 [Phlebia brevispora]|uniref:Uncharacterized protein n=1 Tax=Phlebia brevispora TaxID=194682 RepID=A0ACC1TCG2_9APHY|nr:hypothetical protein NM688_g1110 [Phlebia brevispora]
MYCTPPAEVLYDIISSLLADYVDDLLLGSLALKLPVSVGATSLISQDLATVKAELERNDVAPSSPNPIVPLLCSSYQLRDITLKAISNTLGIEIEGWEAGLKRLKRKPMTKIQPLRLLLASPGHAYDTMQHESLPDISSHFLQLYYVVAVNSTCAAFERAGDFGIDALFRYTDAVATVLERSTSLDLETLKMLHCSVPSSHFCYTEDMRFKCFRRALEFFMERIDMAEIHINTVKMILSALRDNGIQEEDVLDDQYPNLHSMYLIVFNPLNAILAGLTRLNDQYSIFAMGLASSSSSLRNELQKEYEDDILGLLKIYDRILALEPPSEGSQEWETCQRLVCDLRASTLGCFSTTTDPVLPAIASSTTESAPTGEALREDDG